MTIKEFLAALPESFYALIAEKPLQELIDALPKPLYLEILKAVRERYRRDIPKIPSNEERKAFLAGDKIRAFQQFRDRTGASVKEAREAFETGLLDTFTREVFLGGDENSPK